MTVLVAVGDSITAGYGWPSGGQPCRPWAEWVAWLLGSPVLNVATPGVSAIDMERDQLPLLPGEAEIAATMLGANEITGGLVHRSFLEGAPDRVVQGLAKVAPVVLVATIPLGLRGRRNEALVRQANEITRAAAQGAGALLVEVEDAFLDDPAMLGHDRLHLNAAGQLVVAERALSVLGLPDGRPLPRPILGRAQRVVDKALAPRTWLENRARSKGWVEPT